MAIEPVGGAVRPGATKEPAGPGSHPRNALDGAELYWCRGSPQSGWRFSLEFSRVEIRKRSTGRMTGTGKVFLSMALGTASVVFAPAGWAQPARRGAQAAATASDPKQDKGSAY